jgi:hypothetical protein
MRFMFAPSSLIGASRYLKNLTQGLLRDRDNPVCLPRIAGRIACITGAP